jgi:hypothetical protein
MAIKTLIPPRWARGGLGRTLFLGRDNAPRNNPSNFQTQPRGGRPALRNEMRRRS